MFQKIVVDGVTFLLKHRANSPQNSTKRHHKCYDEDVLKYPHRKLWKICRKTYLVQYLFHLTGVASGTFQTSPACYGLFPVVPLFTSDKVTEYFGLQLYYKLTSKKECNSLYKAGQLF